MSAIAPILTLGSAVQVVLGIVFVLISAFMILVILIQKPKGGGLAGAFGGAGGGQQAMFGAKVGDFLTWVTVVLFTVFLIVAVVIVWTSKPPELGSVSPTPNATTTSTPDPVDITPADTTPADTTPVDTTSAGTIPADTAPETPAGDAPTGGAPPTGDEPTTE